MKKIVFIIFLLLTACFCGYSIHTKFYNLISYKNKVIGNKIISINIEPINIPPYLDRPQIITTGNQPTELNISETNRWAEPLDIAIQRVLIRDLQLSLPNAIINLEQKDKTNYFISIKINQFYAKFNDKLILDISYFITDKNGKIILKNNNNFENSLSDNYNNLAEKVSEVINDLSLEIAENIIFKF